MSEFEPTFSLIAGVYRQALIDAQRGDHEASGWLDLVAPDWRVRVHRGSAPQRCDHRRTRRAELVMQDETG